MGWIFQGILTVLATLLGGIFSLLLSVFVDLKLDIGYDASEGNNYGIFDYTYYSDNSAVKGMLDKTFDGAFDFIPFFVALAQAIVILSVVIKMVLAVNPNESDGPGKVIFNGTLAMFGVTYSYTIFIAIEKFANIFYEQGFKQVYLKLTDGSQILSFDGQFIINTAKEILKLPTLNHNALDSVGGVSELTMLLFSCILFLLLLKNFLLLTLESLERYVTLGLLFYTCPLAFATLVSSGTKKIFSSWVQMVIGQFLLMMMNLFFLGVFYKAFCSTFNADGAVYKSASNYILTIMLLIGWLTVGQKVDEILRSCGLSIAQSGHALGQEVGRSCSFLKHMAMQAGMNGVRNHMSHRKAEKSASKDALKSATGQPLTPGEFASSRKSNGIVTKQGSNELFNNKAPEESKYTGSDAMQCLKNMGINEDSDALKTTKDPNGKYVSKLDPSLDYANAVASNGRISIPDKDGYTAIDIGNTEMFMPKDGAAGKNIETSHGVGVMAATQDVVDKDVELAAAKLNADGEKDGIHWEPNTVSNELGESVYDGTLNGTTKDGSVVAQAGLSYKVEPNANKGRIDQQSTGGAPYFVQKLDGQDRQPGFNNIKKTALSPELVSRESTIISESKSSHSTSFSKQKTKQSNVNEMWYDSAGDRTSSRGTSSPTTKERHRAYYDDKYESNILSEKFNAVRRSLGRKKKK